MSSFLDFDATQVDPTNTFDPVPAGDYEVMITDSEEKNTANGNGKYLQLTVQIQSGEFTGRTLFDRLNLDNPNRTAVEIAQRQLSQICHAIGELRLTDSRQLHEKPLLAKVKVRPARGEFEASNLIAGYKPLANMASTPIKSQPSGVGANAPTPPWSARK